MALALDKDVVEALRATAGAEARFDALAPSHRDEYLKWIGEAKTAPTRARRIAGMVERLLKRAEA